VRAGVADIAFGFVIEKVDLLLPTLLDAASLDASRRAARKIVGSVHTL